ncbi:MAG TPA: DUF4197 domain-containing protein [Cytophagales bacterium]|nr:DUF4197 domain-containing protein [Cytophagales bacterium]
MKNMIALGLAMSLTLVSCTEAQLAQALKTAQGIMGSTGVEKLSTEQVAAGLKEALEKGAAYAARTASATNGYWGNRQIRIPLPPELQEVESKLRQFGLGKQVDEFLETMNHGAERAAQEAEPIFVDAIKRITIQDAWNILQGEQNAATLYLKDNTYRRLQATFKPHVENALNRVNATKYYTDVVNAWNRIPGVKKINPNLENYVTGKALDGLFFLVAKEELNIRDNVSARSTELLQKVFDKANWQQG